MALEGERGPATGPTRRLPRTMARGPWATVAAGRILAACCAEWLTQIKTSLTREPYLRRGSERQLLARIADGPPG
jgi:hypothetical protein